MTTDAGFKAFATDGPMPEIVDGAPEGSTYDFMGDEHGRIVLPAGANGPPIGSVVTCVTPHCDPNVNLHDLYHCVRGDRLVDILAHRCARPDLVSRPVHREPKGS